jgi:pyrroloquinoline quinone (PQQ) biosynthesis protein C
MNRLAAMEAEWNACFQTLKKCEFVSGLVEGSLDPRYYRAYIGETFFNARQNVKNMSLFQAHLDTGLKQLEAKFLKHAAMEVGHDEMALADYGVLGGDMAALREAMPLPSTEALAAFIVYHLEALPIAIGEQVLGGLDRMGIPKEATTFLREHADADPVHVKWNKEYIEGFIRTEADLRAALYGIRGTCELHMGMFRGVIESVRASGTREALAR